MNDFKNIRRNEVEKAELALLMKTFGIESESEAYKMAVRWINQYIKNVTNMFFPSSHDVYLVRKKKTDPARKTVW